MDTQTIRTLLVDDFHSVRAGVSGLSSFIEEWAVCGEAASGLKAIELVNELSPDVVILDIHMPDMDGLEVLRLIKQQPTPTEVILYSGHTSESLVYQGFDAGAMSYILKTDSILDLAGAVRAAARHERYYTKRVQAILDARARPSATGIASAPQCIKKLSERDRELVRLLAQGPGVEALAAYLDVSLPTAEQHREAIMQPLGLSSRSQLIRFAIRNGIISA